MVQQIIVGALQTNCYIYRPEKRTDGQCLILDPGGDEGKIIGQLEMLGLTPMGIALTHGHIDHISAVGPLVRHFEGRGINLQVAIHERDRKYLGDSSDAHHKKDLVNLGLFYSEEMAGGFFKPLPPADISLKEGETIFDTDLVVLDTPGHTQGGVCFFSAQDRVLFSGDTLFFEGIGRSDIPGGDERQLVQNIKDKLFSLPAETTVYPGHGPITTIGQEILSNPFTRL